MKNLIAVKLSNIFIDHFQAKMLHLSCVSLSEIKTSWFTLKAFIYPCIHNKEEILWGFRNI